MYIYSLTNFLQKYVLITIKFQFPFEFNGRKYNGCTKHPNPSTKDPLCVEFWSQQQQQNQNENPIKILVENTTEVVVCHNHQSKQWCGTCSEDPVPGTPGFCSQISHHGVL